ncbi:MAG: 23S rRNA (adenine(2503)-C(2))-methyltransferase RlmN [Rhizobiales bacterium]|nr:23S rRNA (adenine(2503)-C(2))-methyltransferase RlmN [Hyphomicrobiales bacterium]NRB15686.1 23S rRNA (adenine(2503)-C(2))-methyltransferase RlmN [Hyphomicrobiales bacterium]
MSHTLDIAKINANATTQNGVLGAAVAETTPENSAEATPEATEAATKTTLPNLVGMPREALKTILSELGIADKAIKMRTAQIWHWLYIAGVTDYTEMRNVNKDLRQKLAENYSIERPEIVEEQISVDGTRKWLMRMPKLAGDAVGHEVECVYIPEQTRGTLCVSSQVGCTLSCTFCHTGTQRMVRNLTSQEIIAQIMVARDRIGNWPSMERVKDQNLPQTGRMISNIVYMGMGEPLYNYEHVKNAINIMADGDGIALSRRRITLSTSGVVNFIEKIGEETGCMLAISLHSVKDDVRDILVPINKKFNLETLLEACRNYPGVSNARRITFEYVMLKDINDSIDDAKQLVALLKGIPAKINLIPFNPWPGSEYECSDWEQIEKFAEVINRAGYASPIRTPRGRDIMAACGQLKSASKISKKVRAK